MSSLKKFSATASSTFKPSSAKATRQTSETPVQSATTANTTKSRLRANVSPSSASSQSTKDLTASPSQSRLPRQNLKTSSYAKGKTAPKKAAVNAPAHEQTQQEQVQVVQQETHVEEVNLFEPIAFEKEVSSPQVVDQASAFSRNTTRRESLEPDSAKKSKFGGGVKSVVTKFTSANRLMSAASSRRQSAAQPEPLSARTRNTIAASPRPAESDGDMTHLEDKEFEKYEKIALEDENNNHDHSHSEARLTYHDNIRRGGSERASTDARNHNDRDESLTKSQFFPKKEAPQAQGDVDHSHLSSSSEDETELEAEQSQGRNSNRSDTPGRSFIDDAANVEMATGPIRGKLVKDPTVPRFAFELSHQKMFDIKSFERKLSQDPREALTSRMGSPRGKEYVSVKSFYHDILKELEQTPLNIEDDSQISFLINKAHRIDQVTFSIVQEKLGPQYSQGLYRIFKKYADNCRSNDQDFMNYTRFLTFAKDFRLFQGNAGSATSRENVGLIFSKRCPTKLIDFAAFVDLLFKMSKNFQASEQGSNRNGSFQAYLDRFVLSQHGNILERQQSPRGRIQAFGREYVAENKALRVLEGHDELIKHVFTLYKSLDIKYSSKSVVQLKDFKNFCTDFCLVPVLVSLNEVHEIFRRFQLGSKPVVDFRGFILAICSIANIGFEKEAYKNKFGDFTKRIMKLFELLADMNSKIAPQLLDKDIKRCKI